MYDEYLATETNNNHENFNYEKLNNEQPNETEQTQSPK